MCPEFCFSISTGIRMICDLLPESQPRSLQRLRTASPTAVFRQVRFVFRVFVSVLGRLPVSKFVIVALLCLTMNFGESEN